VSTFVLSTFILAIQFNFNVEFNPTVYMSGSANLVRFDKSEFSYNI